MDDEAPLLAWYQALTPLPVDIIGDFAGKELFAIHGEALLAYCISEAKVSYQGKRFSFPHRKTPPTSFSEGKMAEDLLDRTDNLLDGFQILHAIHAVEVFLSNLKRRGCQFHIIWFASHERLCVPTDSSDAASGFHRLTRTVLIKHLQHFSAGNKISFEFPDVQSAEFKEYTSKNSLRFFLCLDGLDFEGIASPFAKWHLAFIHEIGSRGYSVALINNFEFKSSKACQQFPFPPDLAVSLRMKEDLVQCANKCFQSGSCFNASTHPRYRATKHCGAVSSTEDKNKTRRGFGGQGWCLRRLVTMGTWCATVGKRCGFSQRHLQCALGRFE